MFKTRHPQHWETCQVGVRVHASFEGGPREWWRSLVVHAQLNYNFRQAITQQLAEKHGLIVSRHDLNAQWWSSIGLNGQCTNKYGNVLARWAREDRMAEGTVLHL